MPGVEVLFSYMDSDTAHAIKSAVRVFGAKEFSTPAITLTEKSFSFKFSEKAGFDELTHNIIVRIRLHNDEQGVRRMADLDQVAKRLAEAIVAEIEKVPRSYSKTVGVELMLVPIGWGTCETTAVATRPDRHDEG